MSIQCPVCELVNDEMALECAECGRQLMSEADLDASIEPIEGLEEASYAADTALVPDEAQLPELEFTRYEAAQVALVERVSVEPTRLEVPAELQPEAPPDDFERGREVDADERTPDPSLATFCPWCKAPSTSKVCDSCGRRRSRYSAPAGQAARPAGAAGSDKDVQSCPNCFARILWAPRCPDCGIPLPPTDGRLL